MLQLEAIFQAMQQDSVRVQGLVERANKGQAAKVQAFNERLSFCWYFLLPSLLNCTLFLTLSSLTLFPSSTVCF